MTWIRFSTFGCGANFSESNDSSLAFLLWPLQSERSSKLEKSQSLRFIAQRRVNIFEHAQKSSERVVGNIMRKSLVKTVLKNIDPSLEIGLQK